MKRLRKSVQLYIRIYLTKYTEPRREHATQFPSVSLFSAETTGTGPIFTKILHDRPIVALVAILNHPYTQAQHYPNPFMNARATNVAREFAIFSQNWLPWQRPLRYRKTGPDRSSAPKVLSFGENIAKIAPADPEIICL